MTTFSKILKSSFLLICTCLWGFQTYAQFDKAPGKDVLNYAGVPDSLTDKNMLSFSDEGAWFAYSIPDQSEYYGGFSGPYIMTQDNGIWLSSMSCQLHINDISQRSMIDFSDGKHEAHSYLSHLSQYYENDQLNIQQKLFFTNDHTAVIITDIKNKTSQDKRIQLQWSGDKKSYDFEIKDKGDYVQFRGRNGMTSNIKPWSQDVKSIESNNNSYLILMDEIVIGADTSVQSIVTQTVNWSPANAANELKNIEGNIQFADDALTQRIQSKQRQQNQIEKYLRMDFRDPDYYRLVSKSILTLQNNWRVKAGHFNYDGFFPSYHQAWFHGFWAWDSWKHSAAAAMYDVRLAKDQVKAMYDFMTIDGFIPDCIFRNSKDEKHNFRNTKPPLSAWAIWKIFENDQDKEFLKEMFPKLIDQHQWWYRNRDHDKDGICEYGSTDGTLEAAKWESGMDNAVRFDSVQIVQNDTAAYSLTQESVDLNSFLKVEKGYIQKIAKELGREKLSKLYAYQANQLKVRIQEQFFDEETGWFYDTDLDGENKVKVKGSEGWLPLWANIATKEQAEMVFTELQNEDSFYDHVPFQTLDSRDNEFDPENGYWRGPMWMDQAYFAIQGLRNYGFDDQATEATKKLLQNCHGIMESGPSLRENYDPRTGKGLNAENFSWTAAHILLLLTENQPIK